MGIQLDPETIERFRKMSAREALSQARDTAFRAGASTSEDFVDLYEQLVGEGILSWAEVDQYDRPDSR